MSHTHMIPMPPPNRGHGPARACGPGILRALWLLLACLAMALPAQAGTRAWLDRNAVSLGEAVTLNIQTDQPGVAPDFRPLRADFDLGEPYRGAAGSDGTLFGIVMTPLREGVLEVPGLPVGGEYTAPLRLVVSAAATAAASAPAARGEVFVETRVDDPAPYVQQSVGLTLRLYYATSLLSGELTQDAPDGASLQRIGDDVQGSREIDGRRYRVLERRYLLVAERSGPLELPPARFSGQGTGGFFDDLFGSGRRISVQADPLTLQVRAQPDGAPQPWLPLRSLALRYVAAPDQARAGEAVEIVVEAVAQGATAAQFPEIPVPRVDGAQVFPERAESTERFVDGSPQLTVLRRYAVVPLQPGRLRVAGPRMDWWDTGTSQARVAQLPDIDLEVSAAVAGAAGVAPAPAVVPAPPQATPADAIALPSTDSSRGRFWPALALGLAGLWLLTLAGWWWSRRQRLHFFDTVDFVAPVVPAGLGFGRIGNWIGGELWGKPTQGTAFDGWGVVFPRALPQPFASMDATTLKSYFDSGALDAFARHPSQLYQATLEGLVLFCVLVWYSRKPRPRYAVTGLFALLYGCFRFLVEFVREPDAQLGYLAFGWLTMGQVLSTPLILLGLFWLWKSHSSPTLQPQNTEAAR